MTLSDPFEDYKLIGKVWLRDAALSASGLKKGGHIIDPRKGERLACRRATWSGGRDAGLADGLSTALMIMDAGEIKSYFAKNLDERGLILEPEGKRRLERFGDWQDAELK